MHERHNGIDRYLVLLVRQGCIRSSSLGLVSEEQVDDKMGKPGLVRVGTSIFIREHRCKRCAFISVSMCDLF